MTGYVYAISNGRGAVKIGWSVDPFNRFEQLRHTSPDELTLIGVKAGSQSDEKAAHKYLREFRIRGEWFDFTKTPVILIVEAMGMPQQTDVRACLVERRRVGRLLNDWRLRNDLRLIDVAERFGVTHGSISHYESGRVFPAAERILNIEKVTGISRHELRPDLYPLEAKAS